MASKKQLQEDFKKERAKAMKYSRLREDCKNVGGERWSGFNTKAILSAFQNQSTLTKSTQEQEPTLFNNTNPKKNQNSIHLNEFIIPYVNATV